MDPFAYLACAGYAATLRPDGRYDVQGMGVMDPLDLVDIYTRLKGWPTPELLLPQFGTLRVREANADDR